MLSWQKIMVVLVVLLTAPVMAAPDNQKPKVIANLPYANESPAQKLDIYLPADGAKTPLPLIIWVHGGAWEEGDKKYCPVADVTRYGFVLASINYRLSREAIFPAQIHDCKAAVRWLRAHAKEYRINPDRITVWGESAGGHLAALLGTSGEDQFLEGTVGENLQFSSKVQAVIDWFGPTDLLALADEAIKSGSFSATENPLTRLFGGNSEDQKKLAELANPIRYATKDDPPFLIMHGTKDPLVPLSQSKILNQALQKAGVTSTLIIIQNAGHGGGEFFSPKSREVMLNFLQTYRQPAK